MYTMSNRFQVLFKSTKGKELDTWLREKSEVFADKSNLESLNNMRVFYIVQAAFDEDDNIFKIGIYLSNISFWKSGGLQGAPGGALGYRRGTKEEKSALFENA